MSVDSHVNPSPSECHSMPRWSASLRSPVFQLPLFRNWTTPTVQPRAQPRPITPNADDDLPLPSPVLTITTDLRAIGPCCQRLGVRRETASPRQTRAAPGCPPAP